ncbi:hypothetical protein [Estrella lausannensis]|uniref:Uncharacterized protein n=1 Tax=Estrella lausannensis TaxID=483423 RepID=A0A0H5DRW0_9BACT|nr:hypothetical protein [Estrella lausannensis]CRX38968.1 Conserved hypothetical protein [Estrella lausannensis]
MDNQKGHDFFFHEGTWLGEGRVQFSGSADEIKFYTKWQVGSEKNGAIVLKQLVEMQGINEKMLNTYTLQSIQNEKFEISLTNDLLQDVRGKGVYDTGKIAWEFTSKGIFEGFEIFEKKADGTYQFHAEYSTEDLFRTVIDGVLWKKF